MKAIYLQNFNLVLPNLCVRQTDILDWVIKCHQSAAQNHAEVTTKDLELIAKLFNRFSVKEAQISQRFTECEDLKKIGFTEAEVYKLDESHHYGIDIYERAQFFSKRALEVFHKMYPFSAEFRRPDHLIHVTCTGYASPSAAQRMVSDTRWEKQTGITHAYHMGCYASMPAIRLAKALVASSDQDDFVTDIVHNEMCGLHMNPLLNTPEQIVVQTLFADGHMKYSVSSQKKETGKNLKLIAICEKLVPDSEDDMSWVPAPWGMMMNLSREVPNKIKQSLENFTRELFHQAGLGPLAINDSIFAIHPGGPKIIDAVQEVLNLSSEQIKESRKVLFERGNMSSATLPHVWDEIINNNYPIGTKVVSYAFGPGLTLFGSVFEVC